jgi:hypothetical protein
LNLHVASFYLKKEECAMGFNDLIGWIVFFLLVIVLAIQVQMSALSNKVDEGLNKIKEENLSRKIEEKLSKKIEEHLKTKP